MNSQHPFIAGHSLTCISLGRTIDHQRKRRTSGRDVGCLNAKEAADEQEVWRILQEMLLRKPLACNALVSFVEHQPSSATLKGLVRLVITLKSTRRMQDSAVLAYSAAMSKWHETLGAKMAFARGSREISRRLMGPDNLSRLRHDAFRDQRHSTENRTLSSLSAADHFDAGLPDRVL